MFQVRIHGRGGQGVVTAAEMLSIAAFDEGKHAQAIPSFGSERMGAPVVAYVRIDDDPIELTEPVLRPVRQFLPNLGGIDVSPVVVILLLFFARSLLHEYWPA